MSDAPSPSAPPTEPPTEPSTGARLAAEGFGSMLFVLALVGTVLFAAALPWPAAADAPSVSWLAGALAAGASFACAHAVFARISGGHVNPAVTLGLAAAGMFPWRRVGGYIAAQTIGALGATTLVVLVSMFGPAGFLLATQDQGFASPGWGERSPRDFGLGAAIVTELALTAVIVLVVLAFRSGPKRRAMLPVALGCAVFVAYLIALPLQGGSLNPARALATAVYGGVGALAQVWVFLLAPVVAALVTGFAYRPLFEVTARR